MDDESLIDVLRVIDEFPTYRINPLGMVWNTERSKWLTVHSTPTGVAFVQFRPDRKTYSRGLANLVAKYFLEAPPLYDTPINKDGDRMNCRYDNLALRPRWHAIRYHQERQNPHRGQLYPFPFVHLESGVLAPMEDHAIEHGVLFYDIYQSVLHGGACRFTDKQHFDIPQIHNGMTPEEIQYYTGVVNQKRFAY